MSTLAITSGEWSLKSARIGTSAFPLRLRTKNVLSSKPGHGCGPAGIPLCSKSIMPEELSQNAVPVGSVPSLWGLSQHASHQTKLSFPVTLSRATASNCEDPNQAITLSSRGRFEASNGVLYLLEKSGIALAEAGLIVDV